MSSRITTKSSNTPDEALIKLRRERKRTTDRAAQREHRRRQKLYVEELELQLARVREGSVNDQVAQLMRENERLQKELNKYQTFFNSVEDLVMDEWQQDHRKNHGLTPNRDTNANADAPGNGNFERNSMGSINQSSNSNDHRPSPTSRNPTSQSQIPSNPSASPHDTLNSMLINTQMSTQPQPTFIGTVSQPSPMVERPELSLDNGTSDLPGVASSWAYTSPQGAFDWSLSSFEIGQRQQSQHAQGSAMMWDSNTSSHIAQDPFVAENCTLGPSQQGAAALSLPSTNLFSLDLSELDPSLIFAPPNQAGVLIHQLLPRILEAQNPEDHHIQSIIESARNQNARLTSPTLADFLCDNPDNALSTAIKHYLEPVRRTRRTIEFLATYWVLYLLLRWQVNRDEESFHNVPTWLRPSITQTRVYHPIGTDLLAWPGIRDEVIMTSLKDPEQAIQIQVDLGLYLEVDIPLHKFSLSHDVGVLHAEISDLNNWRLNKAFFTKYPALQTAYDSSFQHS